ncbi:hypothetical protein OWM54_10295 [Myxococcus sp. MISCRS1]|uniref:hypothetical protein n=1 Tax=unclassified Myxococcus TaxID=2648731 RepID=UPI001CBCA9EE|nr:MULTISPECIES: hypothetical protein [unclassified Myxococcus]MBZ4401491.1 hypothetical protein [Myxococcus sp. AS-1-15]MBZ4412496.1 hypothetical protein [Myxococcus sp. XM-1-1-1]MCY0997525.1 hypothetical protein [Myxococcus sp. MISCRS1]BDT32464.1 hypothetical protein MFMH1_21330 [Myxococcus sp. MH1]
MGIHFKKVEGSSVIVHIDEGSHPTMARAVKVVSDRLGIPEVELTASTAFGAANFAVTLRPGADHPTIYVFELELEGLKSELESKNEGT